MTQSSIHFRRASRRGYTLMEISVATAIVAAAMGMAFSMMKTISDVTNDEIKRSSARTSFERLDDRLYELLAQSRIEVDDSLLPIERIDVSWIEFRMPADTGDGNGLQDGLSPDLRWGASKNAFQTSAAHNGGVAEGKMRISFVPSYEVIDENYQNVAAYQDKPNVWLDSIKAPKMTERTGGTGGVPLEGAPITFTTTSTQQFTVINPHKQNLNTTWERNVIDPNNGINPTAKLGLVDRFYMGLLKIDVILFQPNTKIPLSPSLQPKPTFWGGVLNGATGRPIPGTCYIAVPEYVAYNAICDGEKLQLYGSYKLDQDIDGDGQADPLFSEAGRWYPKAPDGSPIGAGTINALAIKFLVVKPRPGSSPIVYDVFRAQRKISFRNPMYSIKDTYNIADLAPPAP